MGSVTSTGTDKGVHAAANVVSLKMNVLDDVESKINACLPSDIRVYVRMYVCMDGWMDACICM